MDSSNAEKAWEAREGLFTGAPQEARAFIAADKAGFIAGHASRDAEVAALMGVIDSSARTYEELESEHTAALTTLAESRARFADSEARRAELEAALDAVRTRHHAKTIQTGSSTHGGPQQFGEVCSCGTFGCNLYRIIAVPSVVLEDRDREIAARAVEAVARDLAEPRALWWSSFLGPQVQTDEARGTKVSLDEWFAERAEAIRKVDTNA